MIEIPLPLPLVLFSSAGSILLWGIVCVSGLLGLAGCVNLISDQPRWQRQTGHLLAIINILFLVGFLLICWFHLQIYNNLPLILSDEAVAWLNNQLNAMNNGANFPLPLYNPTTPPRYIIPFWIENEKYYFWFFCFATMAILAHYRMQHYRFRAVLHILLATQASILITVADPFREPLPRFFSEIGPWFMQELNPGERIGLFMRLYPKQVFYYNAHYMWFHPPMLFLAYSAMTITFVASLFMLVKREQPIEKLGYDYAKFGYFMLTLGMLLGYPWALSAWGPNWWWDPKICSSIMLWLIFGTYLHTRLYANKPAMWYFSSFLGILCFMAMIFTFLSSFFFPGEHTFQ